MLHQKWFKSFFLKALKFQILQSLGTAGPNDPDTSEHNWSPHNEGCEKFRLISGADEIALNAEMGLYRWSHFKQFLI